MRAIPFPPRWRRLAWSNQLGYDRVVAAPARWALASILTLAQEALGALGVLDHSSSVDAPYGANRTFDELGEEGERVSAEDSEEVAAELAGEGSGAEGGLREPTVGTGSAWQGAEAADLSDEGGITSGSGF